MSLVTSFGVLYKLMAKEIQVGKVIVLLGLYKKVHYLANYNTVFQGVQCGLI